MQTIFASVILIGLVVLSISCYISWSLAGRYQTKGYYIGAVVTTLVSLFGYWYVLFSGTFPGVFGS